MCWCGICNLWRIKGDVIARRDYSPPRSCKPIPRTVMRPHGHTCAAETMHLNPPGPISAKRTSKVKVKPPSSEIAKTQPSSIRRPHLLSKASETSSLTSPESSTHFISSPQDHPAFEDIYRSRTITTCVATPPPSSLPHRGRKNSLFDAFSTKIPDSHVTKRKATAEKELMAQNAIATKDFVWDKADQRERRKSIFTASEDGEELGVEFCTMPEEFERDAGWSGGREGGGVNWERISFGDRGKTNVDGEGKNKDEEEIGHMIRERKRDELSKSKEVDPAAGEGHS